MSDYERGMWDMFLLVSSSWYGKQYYFLQKDGIVYSRESGSYMTVQAAYDEFLKSVKNEG